MKSVKEFFNDNIAEWSDVIFKEKEKYKVAENFYNCYSKAKTYRPKILDIGCGVGYESKILSNLGAKVTGIDYSEYVLNTAKLNVANANFYVADITESLYSLGEFDGAICLETFDYLDEKDLESAFKNIAEILRSGSLLLVSVLNGSEKNVEHSYVKLNGEDYDKNFHCYNAEQLCTFSSPYFRLVDTWQFNDFNEGWRYYVFMKQIINK